VAFDNPVPEDREMLLQERKGYVDAGIIARNEVRVDMGLEPVDGADDLYLDSRLIPIGAEPPEQQAEEFARMVRQKVREMTE